MKKVNLLEVTPAAGFFFWIHSGGNVLNFAYTNKNRISENDRIWKYFHNNCIEKRANFCQ